MDRLQDFTDSAFSLGRNALFSMMLGAAACAPNEVTEPSGGGSDYEGTSEPDVTGYIGEDGTIDACDDAADCEMFATHKACENLFREADGNRAANIQVTRDSSSLVSLGGAMRDEFDTDDDVNNALPHFACTQLFIDSRDDQADGGEWIVSGDSSVTRKGDDLTVQVGFDDLFDYATALDLQIGVLEDGVARWTEAPNGSAQGVTYIVLEDGTIIY